MTTSPLTREQREAARRRCEAASPGPWYFDAHGCCYDDAGLNEPVLEPLDGGVGIMVAVDDTTFIAAARTDLPAALDTIEMLVAGVRAAIAYGLHGMYCDDECTKYCAVGKLKALLRSLGELPEGGE